MYIYIYIYIYIYKEREISGKRAKRARVGTDHLYGLVGARRSREHGAGAGQTHGQDHPARLPADAPVQFDEPDGRCQAAHPGIAMHICIYIYIYMYINIYVVQVDESDGCRQAARPGT